MPRPKRLHTNSAFNAELEHTWPAGQVKDEIPQLFLVGCGKAELDPNREWNGAYDKFYGWHHA